MATKKSTIFPKQIVATKMRAFFYRLNTNSVCQFFKKMTFLQKKEHFSSQPPKKHYFLGFFWNFPFPCFSYCPFYLFQHKKDKNKKCTFFFENPFLTPWQTAKKSFSHPYTLFVFFRPAKNTIKLGKNKQKTILDGFSTQPWTDFQLKNPQILDGFSTLQHIYVWHFDSRSGRDENDSFFHTLRNMQYPIAFSVLSWINCRLQRCYLTLSPLVHRTLSISPLYALTWWALSKSSCESQPSCLWMDVVPKAVTGAPRSTRWAVLELA